MYTRRQPLNLIRRRVKKLLQEGITILKPGYREAVEYFVAPKSKILYIVNSKAGNSAIKAALFQLESGIELPDEVIVHEDKATKQHRAFTLPEDYRDYYSFSFVRNPIDRIASFYTNKFMDTARIKKVGFEFDLYLGGIFSPYEAFDVFLDKLCNIPDTHADKHFVGQHCHLIQRPPFELDYVGKLENFDADFAALSEKYPLQKPSARNSSSFRIPLTELYTRPLLEKLYTRYENDFEHFGYQDYYKKMWEQCAA